MSPSRPSWGVWAAAALTLAPSALALVNYPLEFVEPKMVLDRTYNNVTIDAQQTIVKWADSLDTEGPWTVTNKDILAPSGDKHDYMSWKPYNWPDCSKVGNTTQLSLEQIFKQCTFVNKDGQLNPAARDIHNIEDFDSMANAVFLNALAWGVTRSGVYSARVVKYIKNWFLNEDTYMNPNLNYAQLSGGPDGQKGTHTGILDLKAMAKIASGIVLLRDGSAPEWDTDTDSHFKDWVRNYTQWITTNDIALGEKAAANNHGTYYFAQLASLYVITGDKDKAVATADEYFTTTYQGQITQDGDQPLEHDRTRPYHYLTYNLAGAIAVGRISEYAGKTQWDAKAKSGAGIPDACKYVMSFPPGNDMASELHPYVAAVASIYGDPGNNYSQWLNKQSDGSYFTDASYYWNQPLADARVRPERDAVTYAVESGIRTISVGQVPSAAPASGKSGAQRSAAVVPAFAVLAAGVVGGAFLAL